MRAEEIRSKAIVVLLLNFFIPGLGSIIGKAEIAEALKRTGKDPNATPEKIQKRGIIQIVLLIVGGTVGIILLALPAWIAWIWSFIIDTLLNYYPAMNSVKD
jgi:hypothetical protein